MSKRSVPHSLHHLKQKQKALHERQALDTVTESQEERMYRQKFQLKQKLTDSQAMNTQLKQQIRLMEADFKKKDMLVHRLVEELKKSG